MASRDTDIVGFSTADARSVIGLIERNGTREVREHTPRRGGGRLYVARLNAAWASLAAAADIYTIDGAAITDTGDDGTVYDPLGIFASLGLDDYVLVFKQGSKYYAIQAPCVG